MSRTISKRKIKSYIKNCEERLEELEKEGKEKLKENEEGRFI